MRLVQSKIWLKISQADVGQDPRENFFFFRILESFKNQITKLGPYRPLRQSLAGIFENLKRLAFHCHPSNKLFTTPEHSLYTTLDSNLLEK